MRQLCPLFCLNWVSYLRLQHTFAQRNPRNSFRCSTFLRCQLFQYAYHLLHDINTYIISGIFSISTISSMMKHSGETLYIFIDYSFHCPVQFLSYLSPASIFRVIFQIFIFMLFFFESISFEEIEMNVKKMWNHWDDSQMPDTCALDAGPCFSFHWIHMEIPYKKREVQISQK